MKRIFYSVIVFLVATLLLIRCDKDEADAPVYPSLDAYLKSKNNLTIFSAALDKANLQAFKEGPGPFTWIVPTDEAFQAGLVTMDSLNKMTAGKANYLVQYHLINALLTTPSMGAQNSFPQATQLGSGNGNVYVGQLNNTFYINGGKLLSTDNMVANGVVHEASRLNVPPVLKGNIQAILTTSGQHTLFIAALTRGGRWTTLSSASVYTVFAPTDAAMTAAGYTTASIAAASVGSMDSLVRYHMFSGARIFSNDIGNKTSPGTFLGTTKTLVGSGDGTKIKGTNNAAAFDIVKSDLLAINGVVHFINGVLRY